jgi:hypothetical protein
VNGWEFGCASHRDGGDSACANGIRVRIDLAETKLLNWLVEEILSPAGIALLERRVREHAKAQVRLPESPPKPQAARSAKKAAEMEQLRALMRSGTLSQGVGQAAINQAEQELQAFVREQPARDEHYTSRVIRMLPRVAQVMRDRIGLETWGCGIRAQSSKGAMRSLRCSAGRCRYARRS